MLDEFLKKTNKLLVIMSSVLSVSAIIHAVILIFYGHPIMALLEFCITLALCSSIAWLICRNNEYIKKWNAMNSVEYGATFSDIHDATGLHENIGNLSFDFKKPSE